MVEFKAVDNEIIRRLDCDGCRGHINVCVPRFNNPDKLKKLFIIEKFVPMYEEIKNMEVYEDDIWVMSYPKCGTTWTQEMVWLINNNLNYEGAAQKNLIYRFPFLEESGVLSKFPDGSVNVIKETPRPRHIKSHLSPEFLPDQFWEKNPKTFYVARNPKDAAVSFYHHYRNIVGYKETKDLFMDAFLNDHTLYAPFFEHVLDFWSIRHQPNILFLMYEDMMEDLMPALKKICKHLGKSYTEEELEKLRNHLQADNMRKNPSCNHDLMVNAASEINDGTKDKSYRFIRKAVVGGYKDELSPEYIKKFDEWIAANLKNTDFKFKAN